MWEKADEISYLVYFTVYWAKKGIESVQKKWRQRKFAWTLNKNTVHGEQNRTDC